MKSRSFLSGLRNSSKSFPAMAVLGLAPFFSSLQAADVTWDITPGTIGAGDSAITGGSGTWNADASNGSWTTDGGVNNVAWVNGNNDTAVFGGTAGTVTIDTLDDLGVTVGGLTFSTANYIIAGATGETLTFGAAGDISNGVTATISAVIAGSATITKTGAGTLNLTAVNTFTGDTVISAGTLVVGGNNTPATLGPANYAGNITINGTLLQFTNSTSQNISGIISGSGNLHKAGSNTLTLSGANTYTGKTTVAGAGGGGPGLSVSSLNSVDIDDLDPLLPLASSSLGAPTTVANGTIQLGSSGNVRSCTLIYTGSGETTDRVMNVQFNSGAKHTITSNATGGGLLKFTSNFTITPSSGTATGGLTLRGSGNGEIAQIGTIPGILEKADAGTWTVGGTNAANVVNVTTGTLIVNGTLTAKNATPSINVNGTSTLGGTGTLTATTAGTAIVTAAAGAKLNPGASVGTVGTLTVDGTLNISAMAGGAGVINMDLDSIAASDKIAAGTLNIGTDVLNFADLNFTAHGGLENGTYKLITSGAAVTGTLDPTPANLTGTIGAGPASGTLQISGSGTDIELVVSGVPGGSAYDSWASTNAPGDDPDEDFDGDGVTNAVEFVLGGDKDTNDLGKLPVAATDGTDMTFTFVRDQASIDAATSVSIEVSSDLVTWNTPPSPYAVPDADTGGVVNPGVTVVSGAGTDTVTLRVAQDSAKKFARLKVAIAP